MSYNIPSPGSLPWLSCCCTPENTGTSGFSAEKVEWKAQLQLNSNGSEKEFKQHLCQLYSQRRSGWLKSYKEVKAREGKWDLALLEQGQR